MVAQDAGQATVPPYSLKLEASARRTLPMASWLSTRDRPTTGSIVRGGLAEDRSFFAFSVLVGAIAMEGSQLESDWEQKQGLEEEGRIGTTPRARRK